MNLANSNTVDSSMANTATSSDYVAPGLKTVVLDESFPHLRPGDIESSTWPYLRRSIHHNWYVDARNPTVGFLSRDEAAILYNSALPFKGKPCLEIGCWRGWSTAHIAAATGTLDVIDPILKDPDFFADVKSSLTRAHLIDCVTFYPDRSPEAVDLLATAAAKVWSFVFIDGDHNGKAPLLDAEAVAHHTAETAMVIFHDLVSPHVAAGLAYLRSQGWKTMVYQTMQIMGVAWRGAISPVNHIPDPAQEWTLPAHLSDYQISGWSGPVEQSTYKEEHEQLRQQISALTKERNRFESLFTGLQDKLPSLLTRISDLDVANSELSRKLKQVEQIADGQNKQVVRLQVERNTLAGLLEGLQASAIRSAEHLAGLEVRREALQQKLATQESLYAERTRELSRAQYECDRLTQQLREAQLQTVRFSDQLAESQERQSAKAHTSMSIPMADLKSVFPKIQMNHETASERLTYLARDLQAFWNDAYSLQVGLVLADTIARPRVLLGLVRRQLVLGAEATRAQVAHICEALCVPLNVKAKSQFTIWFTNKRDMLGLVRRLLFGQALEVRCLILWKLNECLRNDSFPVVPEAQSIQSLLDENRNLLLELESFTTQQFEKLKGQHTHELQRLSELERQHAHELRRHHELEAIKLADESALLEAEIEIAALRQQLEAGANFNTLAPVEAMFAKGVSNHA